MVHTRGFAGECAQEMVELLTRRIVGRSPMLSAAPIPGKGLVGLRE
ncbi:hypothetical protein [Paenirhodobacter populi]|nr:hypothetical protein [Sinirhodobacter populi]